MAIGTTRNSLTRLIISAPAERLVGFEYDVHNPFLRPAIVRESDHIQMLVPIVIDIKARKRNIVIREKPVRAKNVGRGTFKEFITSDDWYITVDAMLTYFYESELNFNVRNDIRENDILYTLIDRIGQLGLVPPNELQIRSRSQLVNFLNRVGVGGGILDVRSRNDLAVYAKGLRPENVAPGVVNELRRLGVILPTRGNAIGTNLLGLGTDLIRRERQRNELYPDQADEFPMREYSYLSSFSNVAGGLIVTHPYLEALKIRDVVILNLENEMTKSQHQMRIRIEMVSDDRSIYGEDRVSGYQFPNLDQRPGVIGPRENFTA